MLFPNAFAQTLGFIRISTSPSFCVGVNELPAGLRDPCAILWVNFGRFVEKLDELVRDIVRCVFFPGESGPGRPLVSEDIHDAVVSNRL